MDERNGGHVDDGSDTPLIHYIPVSRTNSNGNNLLTIGNNLRHKIFGDEKPLSM